MAYEFALFRHRYPWVKTFAAWNEVNHCGEPTCHRAGMVVRYYRAMRRLCPRCTVLAGELLDFPNMTSWVKSFQRILGAQPKYWGLHNYRDANRLQTTNVLPSAVTAASRKPQSSHAGSPAGAGDGACAARVRIVAPAPRLHSTSLHFTRA